MPYLITLLGGALKFLAGYAVTRILIALGMGFVTFIGMDILIDDIQNQVIANYQGAPAAVAEIITLCGADVAISILFSAVAIRMLMKGFVSGAVTRLAFKGIDAAT